MKSFWGRSFGPKVLVWVDQDKSCLYQSHLTATLRLMSSEMFKEKIYGDITPATITKFGIGNQAEEKTAKK